VFLPVEVITANLHPFLNPGSGSWEPLVYVKTLFTVENNFLLFYVLYMFSFRSELTKKAEKSSIEVFATNLKNLLLASPVKGKCILGIDPGFRNGCKLAVITQEKSII
jgi:transcriptional accessory protein Tex/SPT6